MKAALSLLFLGAFCAGCVSPKPHNNATATYEKIGDRYVIYVSGTRWGLVHDPISLATQKTYESHEQFDVPRIDGEIQGREIRQPPGRYLFLGSITIRGTTMAVNLSFDNYDEKQIDSCSWNGTYVLVEKKKEPNQALEPTTGSVTPRAP